MNRQVSKIIDKGIGSILFLCIVITLVTTVGVIVLLGTEAFQFFKEVRPMDFFFGTEWHPLLEPKAFGVLPLVVGTLHIVFGSIIFALPVGLLVATYLSEFSSEKSRNFIKPILEILAGIPTVVYGFFALTFITPVLRTILPQTEVFNAISGALVVGIMILPMISSLCDDAFKGVPDPMRQGAYALGATPFEVISQIIFPASAARVGAAVILAVSRAIGETMAVTLAAGATPNLSMNPLEGAQTMTAYIVQVSMGDIEQGGIEYLSTFAVAALLFAITLVMNIIGGYIMSKVRKTF